MSLLPLAILLSVAGSEGTALDAFLHLHPGRTRSVSSHHPVSGDAVAVPPGETRTIVRVEGTGIIRSAWMAVAPDSEEARRNLILRIYWGAEDTPSVEAPFGPFFAQGFGRYAAISSAAMTVSSGGYACFFPMPFRDGFRIELENQSAETIGLLFNIAYQETGWLADDTPFFHAQYRRDPSPRMGEPVPVLEAAGRGHLAGLAAAIQDCFSPPTFHFLEGDALIWLDGEESPSIRGTGTDDHFLSGWYFRDGPFSAPFHGCTEWDAEGGRVAAYRWHVPDPVSFSRSIRVCLEHGQSYNAARADYETVAYWYQIEPHAPFPVLPSDREPMEPSARFSIPGATEAESLRMGKTYYMSTYRSGWSHHEAALFSSPRPGERLAVAVHLPESGLYRLRANFVRSRECGKVSADLDGRSFPNVVDAFSPEPLDRYLLCRNEATGLEDMGALQVQAGLHRLAFSVNESSAEGSGYSLLLDCFLLEQIR